jgi:GNAT superfamily N-acetyltransferase
MTASDFEVRVVAPRDIYALRRRVLRNNDPAKNVADDRDEDVTSLHLGVFDTDCLVACGSFFPSSAPINEDLTSYQLRYLATDVDVQGSGAGTLLLRAAESRLASVGAEQFWANGRDTALGFYRRVGWSPIPGSEHLSAETQLPHTVIYRVIRRTDEVTCDWATLADVPALSSLREEMFFSLALRPFDPLWIVECASYFADEVTAGSVIASVARASDGEVVACAAATLRRVAPTPAIPHGRSAYIHSVSTRPAFRRRGLSRRLTTMLLDELRARGFERAELHATSEGEPLYHSLGFSPRSSPEWRLSLIPSP